MQHFSLKVIQIGNSLGVTFPKEALTLLNVEKGDTLVMTPSPDGARLSTYNSEQSQQLEVARKIMKRRRHALRELAK